MVGYLLPMMTDLPWKNTTIAHIHGFARY